MRIPNSFISSLITLLFFGYIQSGCQQDDGTDTPVQPLEITDSFEENMDGWAGDFADYNVGEEESFELTFEHTFLPAPLSDDQKALKLSGANNSDDLFMFIKKKVSGLEPEMVYKATFTIQFASNVADGLAGIGGSPGESVFVKAGASTVEPEKIVVTDPVEIYRMNVDKGNQSNGGDDAVVIGDFSNDTDESVYTLKTLENDTPFQVTTNENGELWLLVGTDSGFEGTTTIYYNEISVQLELNNATK